MRQSATVLFFVLLSAQPVMAADYICTVNKKYDLENVYTAEYIKKAHFSVMVEERQEKIMVSRCSFSSSEGKVTCDRYEVDRIEFDEIAKIKKYYLFQSQFDLQIFHNLSFLENNGRGGVAYGTCAIVGP